MHVTHVLANGEVLTQYSTGADNPVILPLGSTITGMMLNGLVFEHRVLKYTYDVRENDLKIQVLDLIALRNNLDSVEGG